MAIKKIITIDGIEVPFKASAAVPRLYRLKFRRDIYKDFSALKTEVTEGDENKSVKLSITLDTLTARILKLSSNSQSRIEPTPFYSWWNTTDCRADSAVAPVAHEISPDHRF